ncbi:hypothetical protein ACJMK2_020481 [Sinanodonta woodiana]|uniref:XRCC4 n=1 Tax=Sinanodonta woodiana TaxID=1069815 RepID=A0ABD3TZC9_SINWO
MNWSEFHRILTNDEEECFLLTTVKDGGKEGLDIILCEGSDIWVGEVSVDQLDEMSVRLKIEFSSYVDQTVDAFTGKNEGKVTYQYQLKKDGTKAKFIWKKFIPSEDITFQLGFTVLQKKEDADKYRTLMFNHCISHMLELRDRIHTLETDNERLAQERISALKRLEKCVVAKEELENDLYAKFTAILNSKKERIRELKGQGDEPGPSGLTGTPAQEQSDSERSNKGTQQKRKPQKSDSDENTDDEGSTQRKRQHITNKAGTSKSEGDNSLILEEDKEEKKSQVVARPKRQGGRQRKQTPSKPVLPRVTSNESESGGSTKKTSLRKTPSSVSKRSTTSEEDDLIGGL